MSATDNVITARYRFGRDPDTRLEIAAEAFVDDLAVRRWFHAHDRRRDLARADLDALIEDLAGRPELWAPLVRRSGEQRYYVRLLADTHVEIWLICWCPAQDTGFHDHAGSRGAVAVVSGAVTETRLRVGGPHPQRRYGQGARFSFGATHIHDVQHAEGDPAASLHAYSPPLGEMGFYDLDEDGTLRRRSGEYHEEFC
jgi:predicted metal-dependent enzyme (double-stranded beta helix superfamily)